MAPKNSPEKAPLSKEAQKQQEIDQLKKETRGDLNSLQQFVENIKATVTNFTAIFANAFKSFFNSGSEKKVVKVDKAPPTEQYTYRGPYRYEYLQPQGIANSSDYFQILYAGQYKGKKFFAGAYSTGDKYGTRVREMHETAQKKGLNKFVQGYKGTPLTPDMFMRSAEKYKVDPYAIAAIVALDSSMATRGKGVWTKNPGNVGNTDEGATKKFGSWETGIDAVANNLAKRQRAFENKFELYPGANS